MNDSEKRKLIADMIRELFPDAVAVDIFVSHCDEHFQARYKRLEESDLVNMRKLNGEWVK